MKKLLILILTLISTSLQAQTYTQMQWGMDKTVNPYNFGVNINNAWYNLGSISSSGVWVLSDQSQMRILRSTISTTTIPASVTSFVTSGYYAVGDKGNNCRYSVGTSTGAGAVQSLDGRYWKLVDDGKGLSIGCFGAKVDGVTDDTVATQAAVTAGISKVIIPNGITVLDTVNLQENSTVQCESFNGASIINKANTSVPMNATNVSAIRNVTIRDCAFYSVGGVRAASFVVFNNCRNCILDHWVANSGANSVFVNGPNSTQITITNGVSFDALNDHITVQTGNGSIVLNNNILISSTNGQPTISGLHVLSSRGLYVVNTQIINTNIGLLITPGNGQVVEWSTYVNMAVDGNDFDGIRIQPVGTGQVNGLRFTSQWASSNGLNGVLLSCSAGGTISNITFQGLQAVVNRQYGVFLGCGNGHIIDGAQIQSNSVLAPGSYDGVGVAANVSNWQINNTNFGPVTGYTGTQRYGINIAAGANYYKIISNDFTSGYVTAAINDLANGSDRILLGNSPNTFDVLMKLAIGGATSGSASIVAQAVASTPTLTLPNTSGTFAVNASSPLILSLTTGALTCPTCVTSSGGGAITGTAPVVVSAAGAVSITGAAGQVLAGAGPAFTATPTISSVIIGGAVPTAAGSGGTCATGAVAGGATAGTVTLTGVCANTDTLALTAMPTAPTGYVCDAADRTAKAIYLVQSATSTTSATFTFNATTGATDVIQYKCVAY